MTKRELLEQMQRQRREWDEVIRSIPSEHTTRPAIYNGWSIKDTIGHVTYYERWLVDWLEAAVRGKVKVATHQDSLPVDERNALIWEANKNRTLDDLLMESQQVWDRLYYLVSCLPEEDLFDAHRFERYVEPFYKRPQSLYECIRVDSLDHYAEHLVAIREWVAAVLATA